HLRIAGARRQGAQYDGGTTALAADELADGIDHLGREGDDGRAPRQAGELLLAGISELREARARHEARAGKELVDDRAHSGSTEQHRLIAAAAVEKPVGEDMAAFEIRGE